jgi:hypothetical protein
MAKKQLKITVTDTGDLKIDASQMPGSASQILDELKDLAELVGGDVNALVVEQRVAFLCLEFRVKSDGLNYSEDVVALNPGLLASARVGQRKPRGQMPRIDGRPVKSLLEWRAWTEWVPLQQPMVAKYEPLSFALTGGNYRPDFVLKVPSGETWVIEVKGSWRAFQSGRSSRRNLRQAAVEFAWFGRWFSLMPKHGEWELTEYGR